MQSGQRQVLPVPAVRAESGVRLRRGLRVPRGRELPQRCHHRLLPPLPAVQPHERGTLHFTFMTENLNASKYEKSLDMTRLPIDSSVMLSDMSYKLQPNLLIT